MKEKALVSACLIGVKCRYDGGHSSSSEIGLLSTEYELIPICPEQLGGLTTPRPKAELSGGDGEEALDGNARVVQVDTGNDVTQNFLTGARETLTIAQFTKAGTAYLKNGSPSCGFGTISKTGKKCPGNGVTTALLLRNGLTIQALD